MVAMAMPMIVIMSVVVTMIGLVRLRRRAVIVTSGVGVRRSVTARRMIVAAGPRVGLSSAVRMSVRVPLRVHAIVP